MTLLSVGSRTFLTHTHLSFWLYGTQSLGPRLVHAVFSRNGHGIKRNHIVNAIGVDSAAADALRLHGEARVVEQG